MKDKINKFKEAWKHPGKRAGIKLLIYITFFIILLAFAGITNNIEKNNNKTNNSTLTTTTVIIDKYSEKQIDLLTNKYNINYEIKENDNEYKINGTLNNNIVNGYLEMSNDIKKIIIKDNKLYEIINEQEILLDNNINKDFISINYIINLIKQNSSIISDNKDTKSYSYNIEDTKIVIYTDEKIIKEINIEKYSSKYILKFDK